MLIKKLFSFIVCTTFALSVQSQLSAVDFKDEKFISFKASKTFIVKTGNEKFDSELLQAFKESWKLTPYDVITKDEFDKKISDKSCSFIFPVTIETKNINQAYHYLAFFNGGKKSLKAYDYEDMIAYCPINHFLNEGNNVDCAYRVRNMLESMCQSIDLIQKKNIKGNPLNIAKALQEIYNAKSKNIKNRTLLLPDYILGKVTKADIAGLYPHRFEICSQEKIEQVIKDKSTEYYYYQPGITLNKSMFVFDPSNGEVVYFSFQMMGLNIKKKDIEELVETISGKN